MNITRIDAWMTIDGSIFRDQSIAADHARKLATDDFLKNAPGGLLQRDYLEWLTKYKQAIVEWAVAEGVKCTCTGGGDGILSCYHCNDYD